MQELKPIKEGKVREIYDNGDSLIMVATDRISCCLLYTSCSKRPGTPWKHRGQYTGYDLHRNRSWR